MLGWASGCLYDSIEILGMKLLTEKRYLSGNLGGEIMFDSKYEKRNESEKGMDIKVIIGGGVLIILFLWILIATHIKGDIVGTWYSREMDETWTFSENGVLTDGDGNTTGYSVKGKRIYIEGEEDDAIFFEVMGDTLTLESDDWGREYKFRKEK